MCCILHTDNAANMIKAETNSKWNKDFLYCGLNFDWQITVRILWF